MGFFRQEYWSGLPFPSPGDLPHPGIQPGSPALQADNHITINSLGESQYLVRQHSRYVFFDVNKQPKTYAWVCTSLESKDSLEMFSSVQSLSPVWLFLTYALQHARLLCPSLTLGVCSNSGPSSWWCHPTVSSSVVPLSSCLQSFPASSGQVLEFQLQHQSFQWMFRTDFL